jgi:hypothetical protein
MSEKGSAVKDKAVPTMGMIGGGMSTIPGLVMERTLTRYEFAIQEAWVVVVSVLFLNRR